MTLNVEYKDVDGIIHNRSYTMTRFAFVMHMVIAGQGCTPRHQKFLRIIGMFIHFSPYMQRQAFYNSSIAEPPFSPSELTEKGQFSNLVGKAIADLFSKRIDNFLYTVNYEAVIHLLGQPLSGCRPYLVTFSPASIFATEAKSEIKTIRVLCQAIKHKHKQILYK